MAKTAAQDGGVVGGGFDWLKIVERLGSMGLLMFVLWYVFSSLIPSAQATYQNSLKVQQDQFSIALKDQQTDFKATLKEQRQDFLDSLKDLKVGK